jgi:hypothetical protein
MDIRSDQDKTYKLKFMDYLIIVLQVFTLIITGILYMFNFTSTFDIVAAVVLTIVGIVITIFFNSFSDYIKIANVLVDFIIVFKTQNPKVGLFKMFMFFISYIIVIIKLNSCKRENKSKCE